MPNHDADLLERIRGRQPSGEYLLSDQAALGELQEAMAELRQQLQDTANEVIAYRKACGYASPDDVVLRERLRAAEYNLLERQAREQADQIARAQAIRYGCHGHHSSDGLSLVDGVTRLAGQLDALKSREP